VEIYSFGEIAAAAGVPVGQVERHAIAGGVPALRGFVTETDAVRLLRAIALGQPLASDAPGFFAVVKSNERRGLTGLVTSGAIHVVIAAVVIAASFGLVRAADTQHEDPVAPARLVYLMTPGPGGGGGGGGVRIPLPTRRAERKAPEVKKISSPIPEVQPPPPPPTPKVDPPPAPPPPVVQAPVVSKPADPVEAKGIPIPVDPPVANQGAGTNGGAGTGAGQGVGAGTGSGIGAGSGGGEGGGPYQPGAGIDPPSIVREVKATYTDDARRRGIEGEVLLQIVVRADGSVGDVRVRRGLESGLDQRAIDAVRQWRFSPAKRRGAAVDVVVEVSVEFKLR
jgi:TonB family protein